MDSTPRKSPRGPIASLPTSLRKTVPHLQLSSPTTPSHATLAASPSLATTPLSSTHSADTPRLRGHKHLNYAQLAGRNQKGQMPMKSLRNKTVERKQTQLRKVVAYRNKILHEFSALCHNMSLVNYGETNFNISEAIEAFHGFAKDGGHAFFVQEAENSDQSAEQPVAGLDEQSQPESESVAKSSANQSTDPSIVLSAPPSQGKSSVRERSPPGKGQSSAFVTQPPAKKYKLFQNDGIQKLNDELMAKASHDALILNRVSQLQREGFWNIKRMQKHPEPPRNKVHWDYLLEEMEWMSQDFKEERKWKTNMARKISKAILKHFEDIQMKDSRVAKEDELRMRKMAAAISRDVRKFWAQIGKLLAYKQQLVADEEIKKAREKNLDFLVQQTEKYSTLLVQEFQTQPSNPAETVSQASVPQSETPRRKPKQADNPDDNDYQPDEPEGDDENTLDAEETEDMVRGYQDELEKLKEEGDIPIEELLRQAGYLDDEGNYLGDQQDSDQEGSEDTDSHDTKENHCPDENPHSPDEANYSTPPDQMNTSEHRDVQSDHITSDLLADESASEDDEDDEEDGDALETSAMETEHGQTEQERIQAAADAANSAQPTGYTLTTTSVKTPIPVLLKNSLREYQHVGLDWLVKCYEKQLNCILADEMGLGKTVMTISLLAHLACAEGIWGPHLIIVPSSVLLNWEMEFKRWCPGFKLLTYFGNPKDRKMKRLGWSKPNSFHVCITSYKVVLQDATVFRRKKWKYMILDEAHNIKNFKSQRWQTLLNFQTKRRLLLTGTPLQNSLMELWSLMHFLMPHIFQSHKEFKSWFSNPVANMVEGNESMNEDVIRRLYQVLRPFLLRRLKKDVEKQLPNKYEHVVMCRLSKRQRFLYEEFMANSSTQETLASGHLFGIIGILMQLRKVCNHPDLFEARPIISSFDMEAIIFHTSSLFFAALNKSPFERVDLDLLNLEFARYETMTTWDSISTQQLAARVPLIQELDSDCSMEVTQDVQTTDPVRYYTDLLRSKEASRLRSNQMRLASTNSFKCSRSPLYGLNLRRLVHVQTKQDYHFTAQDKKRYMETTESLNELFPSLQARVEKSQDIVQNFAFLIPRVRACAPMPLISRHRLLLDKLPASSQSMIRRSLSPYLQLLTPASVRMQLYFPDKRLIQYDCGKLQVLADLLHTLKADGHRCLIFTQMTKMLDILEEFLNLHGHTYLRLDGSTKIDQRQLLMDRFNNNKKIFLFILSTRSGGIGVNLTGADTVIFYDSDWNPSMDAQAQDRCHRIGQTREVHIYRLVTEKTVEENIIKKANQKRSLDHVVTAGEFTTDFFSQTDIREFLQTNTQSREDILLPSSSKISAQEWEAAACSAEDVDDVAALQVAKGEIARELDEFNESIPIKDDDAGALQMKGNSHSDLPVRQESNDADEFETIKSRLTPIQRYALNYLQGVADPTETIDQTNRPIEGQSEGLFVDPLERIQEEQRKIGDVEDVVSYEVFLPQKEDSASRGKSRHDKTILQLLKEQEGACGRLNPDVFLYCPPEFDDEAMYIPAEPIWLSKMHESFLNDEDMWDPLQAPADEEYIMNNDSTVPGLTKESQAQAQTSTHDRAVPKSQADKKEEKAKKTKMRKSAQHSTPAMDFSYTPNQWTVEEENALVQIVKSQTILNWDMVGILLSATVPVFGRRYTAKVVQDRWKRLQEPPKMAEPRSQVPSLFQPVPSTYTLAQRNHAIIEAIKHSMRLKKSPVVTSKNTGPISSAHQHASHHSHVSSLYAAGKTAQTPREIIQKIVPQTAASLNAMPLGSDPSKTKLGSLQNPDFGPGQGQQLPHQRVSVPPQIAPYGQKPSTHPISLANLQKPGGSMKIDSEPHIKAQVESSPTIAQGQGVSSVVVLDPSKIGQQYGIAQINQIISPRTNQPTMPTPQVQPTSSIFQHPMVAQTKASETPAKGRGTGKKQVKPAGNNPTQLMTPTLSTPQSASLSGPVSVTGSPSVNAIPPVHNAAQANIQVKPLHPSLASSNFAPLSVPSSVGMGGIQIQRPHTVAQSPVVSSGGPTLTVASTTTGGPAGPGAVSVAVSMPQSTTPSVASQGSNAPPPSSSSGGYPISVVLGIYAMTQIPDTAQVVLEVMQRPNYSESQKADALRRLIHERISHTL